MITTRKLQKVRDCSYLILIIPIDHKNKYTFNRSFINGLIEDLQSGKEFVDSARSAFRKISNLINTVPNSSIIKDIKRFTSVIN